LDIPTTSKSAPGTAPSAPGEAVPIVLRRPGEFVLASGLIEGTVAGCALMVFVFVWQIFPPFSLVLAIGIYFGVLLLLHRPNSGPFPVNQTAASDVGCILEEIEAQVARIEAGAERIPVAVTRAHVHAIARSASGVLADFRERPRHASGACFVCESLLEAAVTALARYERFSQLSSPAAERGREVLESRAFPIIARSLEQLLEQLLQDDLRTLDIDLVLLDQMLYVEGLSEAEPLRDVTP